MTIEFSLLPSPLQNRALHQWHRFEEAHSETVQQLLPCKERFLTAFALSDYISESCITQPALALELYNGDDLACGDRCDQLTSRLQQQIALAENETDLLRLLRQFRRQQMVVIAWRELLGLSSVQESLTHLSALAVYFIELTLEWLFEQQCKQLGTPVNEQGEVQKMLVLAMGKLGGGELNYSSDIDLIFTFPENGKTQGGRRSIGNQEFFIKLGQKLVQALNQTTVDGFVYRVDMRLRPFGSAGPLVISFAALEDYYQHQGREWERFAMVKARVLGGSAETREALEILLRPFIFRRYVDYSAIDSLRSMKSMINAEIRRKGLVNNIKLGAGGIREVEFIAQAFQLIRGGREPQLRIRNLLHTLSVLDDIGSLPTSSAQTLTQAYVFLRQVENRLQQFADQQTQTLPDNEIDKARLVVSMNCADWEQFYQQLEAHMQAVHQEFLVAIGEQEQQQSSSVEPVYIDLWQCENDDDAVQPFIQQLPENSAQLAPTLLNFKLEMQKRTIGPRGQASLDQLVPLLLQRACMEPDPVRLLSRVFHLLEAIASRTAYIELLLENPGALTQLLRLLNGSDFISEQLASYPLLLDELLDPQHLYNPVAPEQYQSELRQFMLRIDEDDLEQQMEGLRQFKQLQMLRIAAADVAGVLPLMKVSDHLTALAEAILGFGVELAWQQMTARFGLPANVTSSESEAQAPVHRGFAVIGYGKMGGIELSYSSDLDLVFLHNCSSNADTSGPKAISSREFYLKLAQRIMHLFNTRMASGILYELDLRLRPSGASGLMVASLESFEQYQQQQAWTWEHQALVRARTCYGEPLISADFSQIRKTILCKQRDLTELKADIVKMRLKMREHLLRGEGGRFDLKQSPGGMVDIEFLAQYLVLAYSHQYPQLCRFSDNIRIFEIAAELSLLTSTQAQQLISAYIAIRNESNRLTMQRQTRLVEENILQSERQNVISIWNTIMVQ